jgi:hypothetical protein
MRHPARAFRDIIAAQRSGEGSAREGAGDTNAYKHGFEDVSFHGQKMRAF